MKKINPSKKRLLSFRRKPESSSDHCLRGLDPDPRIAVRGMFRRDDKQKIGVFKGALILFFIFLSSIALSTEKPLRIVSLKPNITDIVYAIGAGDGLIGVTKFCDVPEGKNKPKIVGDYSQAYIEKIIALAPDIILASKENSSRRSIETLQKVGFDVRLFSFSTFEETLGSIRDIGEALGLKKNADVVVQKMNKGIAELEKKLKGSKTKRVIIVWGTRPIVVAGPGSYIDELLPKIGAVNVVTSSKVRYPKIGIEEMIGLRPDAIIDLSMGNEENILSKPWSGIDAIKAVRDKKIVTMNAKDFKAAPRLVDAMGELAAKIH